MIKKNKIALITGVTGQDGAYLSEFLIKKGYIVHGIKRRTSSFNTQRIDKLYQKFYLNGNRFFLHHGDMTDGSSIINLIKKIKPDEIYNLAAQSHVSVSFEQPEYTADVNAFGVLRILEAIKILGIQSKTKFYQASTSELFGYSKESPQSETTPFYPKSPYGVSKLYAYWITVNYREAYNIFGCNGILFNHESPYRGETFVTRKITRGLSRIKLGLQKLLYLGNLDAKRDWGHAKDYVEMQWMILQQKKPDDYIIASGHQHSVRDFVNLACEIIGIKIKWEGKGKNEKGYWMKLENGKDQKQLIVRIDSKYFRPAEVNSLLGDTSKATKKLKWKPKYSFRDLVDEMIKNDIKLASKEKFLIDNGYNKNV